MKGPTVAGIVPPSKDPKEASAACCVDAEQEVVVERKQSRRVRFTHLNYSNPALEKGGAAKRAIEVRGFRVVKEGETVGL